MKYLANPNSDGYLHSRVPQCRTMHPETVTKATKIKTIRQERLVVRERMYAAIKEGNRVMSSIYCRIYLSLGQQLVQLYKPN